MIRIGLEIHTLPSPYRELLFALGLLILLLFIVSIFKLIRAFKGNRKLTRLYENRQELPPLTDDLEKAEEVWVSWRVGSTAKTLSQEIWDNTHFKRLLLHHPLPTTGKPDYLAAHILSFPNRSLEEAREDILSATRQAPSHIDIRWLNGYIGDSLLIFNPHTSGKKGLARIEATTAASQANDRPSIEIREKQYPKLFKILVKNYEIAFNKGTIPDNKYRQPSNVPRSHTQGSETR